MVNRKYVDTILHTLLRSGQNVIRHMVQFDQERVQRIPMFHISRIKLRNSALVVKPEKSLLQDNGSVSDAPGIREH